MYAADPLDALRLKDSAVLGLGPEVHGKEAVDVGGRRDDRHRAARFCQRPGHVYFIYIGVHCVVTLSLFYKRLCNKYLGSQK